MDQFEGEKEKKKLNRSLPPKKTQNETNRQKKACETILISLEPVMQSKGMRRNNAHAHTWIMFGGANICKCVWLCLSVFACAALWGSIKVLYLSSWGHVERLHRLQTAAIEQRQLKEMPQTVCVFVLCFGVWGCCGTILSYSFLWVSWSETVGGNSYKRHSKVNFEIWPWTVTLPCKCTKNAENSLEFVYCRFICSNICKTCPTFL